MSSLLEGNCFLFFFSLVSFFPRLTHFTSLATEVVLILLSFLHDFQPLFRPRTSGNKIDHTGYLKCKQREDMEDIWLSDIYLSEVTLTNTDSNTSLTLNLFRTMSEKATWSQKDLGNVWKHTNIWCPTPRSHAGELNRGDLYPLMIFWQFLLKMFFMLVYAH